MPANDPQFGEIWAMTDATGRNVQGIIADVSPTRVTLVSLTGNRTAIAPTRLPLVWRFVQSAPRRILPECGRAGCHAPGMLLYMRAPGPVVEYSCPRHAPHATQSTITANYEVPEVPPPPIDPTLECRATPCINCGNTDPAEDLRIACLSARLWFCPICSSRWVSIPKSAISNIRELITIIDRELQRIHFESEEVTVLDHDLLGILLTNRDTIRDPQTNTITLTHHAIVFSPGSFNEEVRNFFAAIIRVRSAERALTTPVQRLGGAPNRAGVVGESTRDRSRMALFETLYGPLNNQSEATNNMVYGATNEAIGLIQQTNVNTLSDTLVRMADVSAGREPAHSDIENQRDDLSLSVDIDKGSRWLQRQSGDIIVVMDIIQATDHSDVVVFRRESEEGESEPRMRLNRRDFVLNHAPYIETPSKIPPRPTVQVAVGEEWEARDGTTIIVREVDNRKEIVSGEDVKNSRKRDVPFGQFIAGRWRRIIRKSMYELLLNPEIGDD